MIFYVTFVLVNSYVTVECSYIYSFNSYSTVKYCLLYYSLTIYNIYCNTIRMQSKG